MIVSAACSGCGESFGATRRDAKWCSDRCRKIAAKATGAPSRPSVDLELPTGLVDAVESELAKAGVSHTFAGQLAVSLAKRLSAPDETGVSSLSKELRTVMAAALTGVTPPSGQGEDDDEVTKAREARERKARFAAGRA